jgi:steroid 5-alpha reductase family enzyme
MTAFIIIVSALLVAYISVWFVVGKRLKRIDVADTAWGGGFIIVASAAFKHNFNYRTATIWVLVMLWGMRLIFHIWRRNVFKGPDPRYEEISAKWNNNFFWLRAYFSIFMTQGLLMFIVSAPIIVSSLSDNIFSKWLILLGAIFWTFGFIIESVADRQLTSFIRTKDSKTKILQTGLWKYSRHPNYFGELIQWWSIGIIALSATNGYIGLIGPAVLTYLIVFVSGIPLTEKRYSNNPEYKAYQKRTNAIFILPRREN